MQKQNAETKLYGAVTRAMLAGKHVEPGTFIEQQYDGVKTKVCLCGSVLIAAGVSEDELVGMNGENIIKKVARKLGITLKQAASLNNGFEATGKSARDTAGAYFSDRKEPLAKGVDSYWYGIGNKLRKAFDGE